MKRVVITRHAVGIYSMQVCAVLDASDEEILQVCNDENPSGTPLGWCSVCRAEAPLPVQCADDPDRVHLIVDC